MESIFNQKDCNVVVIGDTYVSPDTMEAAVFASKLSVKSVEKLFWGTDDKDEFDQNQMKVERGGAEAVPYPKELDECIRTADIIMTHYCPIPEAVLQAGKQLKAIITCRGGVEHIDMVAATKRQIPVVTVVRNAEAVAEFTLGMCISLTRNIATSYHALKCKKWEKQYFNTPYVMTLSQYKVGLVGLGNIGLAFARKLLALGVMVVAYDPYVTPKRLEQEGVSAVELVDSTEEIFQTADIVSLHMRLTKETERTIDWKYFSLMKPTAYLVNTARGGLINYEDLHRALQEKVILGAALDVFEKEPVESDNPLLAMENVLLTSHIAGTTVDAISQAPYLLMKEVDRIVDTGTTHCIVNYTACMKKKV